MHAVIVSIIALAQAAVSSDDSPSPEPVFLGALATNVRAYLARPIEVCGHFEGHSSPNPTERIMSVNSRGEGYWFLVEGSATELPDSGSFGCVVGSVRRRDGLTPEEARRQGRSNSYVADGLQDPDYVLYPSQSVAREPTDGLAIPSPSTSPPSPIQPPLEHPGLNQEINRLAGEHARMHWVVANDLSVVRRALDTSTSGRDGRQSRDAANAALSQLRNDLRRLARLQRDAEWLAHASPSAAESDRARLREIAQRFREVLRAMEGGYVELLEAQIGPSITDATR